jgi:hypothetical protein
MSEKGDSAFPGDELLGEETNLSRGTIRTHRHILEAQGWVVLVEPGGGRGRANKYQATIPAAYWDRVDAEKKGQEATGMASVPGTETGQQETGYVETGLEETGHLTMLNRSSDDAKPVSRRPPGRKESVIRTLEPLPSAEILRTQQLPPQDLAERLDRMRRAHDSTAPMREAERRAKRAGS